jgi:hypothetical protein
MPSSAEGISPCYQENGTGSATSDHRHSCCQRIACVPYLAQTYSFPWIPLDFESQDVSDMMDLQSQVNERVSAFVTEITELARQAAYEMLASSLDQQDGGGRGRMLLTRGGTQPRRKGAKRTSDELAGMADAFMAYINVHPGQRMEHIAKELGYDTQELTLPVRKLLSSGQIQVEGQKRATSYFPASARPQAQGKTRGRGKTRQARRRRA